MTSRITIEDANIVAPPTLNFSGKGTAVANIRIAVNKRTRNPDGTWEKGDSTFLTCVAFGQRAERIAEENFQPGDLVFASGLFENKPWKTKEGEQRYSQEVTLDAFGRDLKWIDKSEKKPADNYDDQSVPF